MEMILVDNLQRIKQFLELPDKINQGDPNWIRPLDKDIEAVFDKKKNKLFRKEGNACKRWLLEDDNGEIIGKVAAFVNKKYKNTGDTIPVGGIGFFDCVNRQEAANFIFDFCRNWLQEKGMQAMDGPINFGERNEWWGLLVEGFYEPLYQMNYNPPYYQALFENYGFKAFFHQNCYTLRIKDRLQEKFYHRHKQLSADPNFHSDYLKKNNIDKYAADFCTVYNKAWAGHGANKNMELRQAKKIFQSMKPVIDEKIVWYVYHKEEPIGIFLNLPDLNQWFKYLHGKFDFWHKLQFLWLKKTKKCHRIVGLVFGIVPEFQGMGADAYMIMEAAEIIQKELPYEDYEMQWIGDFNPKMISVAQSLGTRKSRVLTSYRYLFDRNQPFERHPIVK